MPAPHMPLYTRAARKIAVQGWHMGPHNHVTEVDLKEGRMRLVRLEGSSVVARVQTRQTPRKV